MKTSIIKEIKRGNIMNLARNIGYHLYILLDKHNISIENFSKDMWFTISEMHYILEGRKIVPPNLLKKFAIYFNVTPDYFLNPCKIEKKNSWIIFSIYVF